MQVLLRTASTYARACLETAGQIDLNATQRMSVHQNVPVSDRLQDVAETTLSALEDVLELYATRAEIRRLIGHGNDEAIDTLLAERDALNSQEKVLNTLIEALGDKSEKSSRRRLYGLDSGVAARLEHDAGQVTAALESIRQRMTTVTTGDVADYIEVPSLSKDQVNKLKQRVAAIRRRRTILNDQLAAENLRQHITLPAGVVTVLRKHQIVD